MRPLRCRGFARLHSAYLDGVLSDTERDQMQSHLGSCSGCRSELEDLRRVRSLLAGMSGVPAVGEPPAELSARLVSIAGPDASSPVWCRPFRRTAAGVLPSRRRALRVRVTAAAMALGGLFATAGVVGYAAAPPSAADVRDPVGRALSEFGAMLSELPLSNRPADALLVTARAGQLTPSPRRRGVGRKPPGRPTSTSVAVATLRRAVDASAHVRFRGTQQVSVGHGDQLLSAAVQVHVEPGQGTAVRVLDRRGGSALERLVPPVSSASVQQQLVSLVLQNYDITAWQGQHVLGRPVTLVQAAASPTTSSGRRTVSRWWVDDSSGVVLRQETQDAAGLTMSAAFTEVVIGPEPSFLAHLAPRLAVSSLPAASADQLVRGWSYPRALAGLSLVQVREDEATEPGVVHLMYSDGVRAASVFEQRGALTEPPMGTRWDGALQAWRHDDASPSATWRSADTVFTVVSDAPDLLAAVVTALPHEPSVSATTMDRVHAGWSRIREHVTG